MFQIELNYFMSNQTALVAHHRGKILVIKGEELLGVYDSTLEAYKDATKKNKPGTFMIQRCEPGSDAYTVTIATRGIVSF